jgi:DnaJ-domain-containing protein 1
MTIGPEHIAAVICAVVGYALVSAVLKFSAGRSTKKENNSGPSDSKTGAHSGRESEQWFAVLGVSPSASVVEIKAAYRARISGYHPDKVASLADELRELAEMRSKAINDAYATAMRLRR